MRLDVSIAERRREKTALKLLRLARRFAVILIVVLMVVSPYLIFSVQAAEPSLVTVLTHLGFTNINLTDVETFPACAYNITLYAEFAGYSDENELSYYELDDPNVFNVIFTGPEGGSEYIVPPINKSFTADYEFGLSMLSHFCHRYFTETARNPDYPEQHAEVYENLDSPGMFLIGFENLYGGGDRDFNDMVFSIKPVEYTLAVNVVGSGSVSKDPDQATYPCGTVVNLTAVPDAGWAFSHWSGDLTGSTNPDTITMDSNKIVTAHFTQMECTLTITTTSGGTTDPSPGSYPHPCSSNVQVTAIPDPCYMFDHWELDTVNVGSANPYTVTMDDDHTLHAVFTQIEYTLTITSTAGGTTDPSPGSYPHPCSSNVQVTAIPDPCYMFDHWELDSSWNYSNPITVHMDANYTLKALFKKKVFKLTIQVEGTGTTNPSPGTYTYDCCTNVTVTAIETDPCWRFDHWELDSSNVGSANPYTVHMDINHTLKAVFVQETFWLTIQVDGTGTTDPTPGVYEYNCSEYVSVTAIETDPCWNFDHWELNGSPAGSANPITVHIDDNHTIRAVFTKEEYTLTVNVVGSGSVTKDPDQGTYPCGSVVELTAVPDAGWTFSHWSGDLTGSMNPKTITMNGDKSVTAHFIEEEEFTLTVNVVGNGSVTKNPDQVTYPCGTVVTLTAVPDANWTFSHWSGDLTGSMNPKTITMNGDKSVTAHFTTTQPPPKCVGGEMILFKASKPSSLQHHMELFALFLGAAVASIFWIRRKKRRQ